MDLSEIQQRAWETAEEKGFHKARDDSTAIALALIHSEVSEALEADRGGGDVGLANKLWREWEDSASENFSHLELPDLRKAARTIQGDSLGEELADIIIRVADLAEQEGIDLDTKVQWKMGVNEEREHKHGKEY